MQKCLILFVLLIDKVDYLTFRQPHSIWNVDIVEDLIVAHYVIDFFVDIHCRIV